MRIALDYDNTYSADPAFWQGVAVLAAVAGHDVRIVTARDERFDRTAAIIEAESVMPVIFTRGVAKRWFLEHFGNGWLPEVWIDDKPEAILQNSPTSPKDLAEWRRTRADGPHAGDAAC